VPLGQAAILVTPDQGDPVWRRGHATRDRYAIHGYISTVAKHGAHILTAIHDALSGDPWMPLIPSPP
jgi:hypothetical protein